MASLRQIKGAWILDWRDGAGERHRDTLGRCDTFSERDAKRILKQRELELSAGFAMINAARAPIFGQFAADYLAWHAAEYPSSHYRTAQIVQQHLMPEFEFFALDALNPRDVDGWKHRRLSPREKKPKAETVAKELRTLKAMLSKAVEWRLIREHPIPYRAVLDRRGRYAGRTAGVIVRRLRQSKTHLHRNSLTVNRLRLASGWASRRRSSRQVLAEIDIRGNNASVM